MHVAAYFVASTPWLVAIAWPLVPVQVHVAIDGVERWSSIGLAHERSLVGPYPTQFIDFARAEVVTLGTIESRALCEAGERTYFEGERLRDAHPLVWVIDGRGISALEAPNMALRELVGIACSQAGVSVTYWEPEGTREVTYRLGGAPEVSPLRPLDCKSEVEAECQVEWVDTESGRRVLTRHTWSTGQGKRSLDTWYRIEPGPSPWTLLGSYPFTSRCLVDGRNVGVLPAMASRCPLLRIVDDHLTALQEPVSVSDVWSPGYELRGRHLIPVTEPAALAESPTVRVHDGWWTSRSDGDYARFDTSGDPVREIPTLASVVAAGGWAWVGLLALPIALSLGRRRVRRSGWWLVLIAFGVASDAALVAAWLSA